MPQTTLCAEYLDEWLQHNQLTWTLMYWFDDACNKLRLIGENNV